MLTEVSQIGKRMRNARVARAMTGQKAAECLSISGAYLSQIEKGRRRAVPVELIIKASHLYGVTTCYLMGCTYPPSFEVAARLHACGAISKEQYREFWAFVKSLAAEAGFDACKFVKDLGFDLSPTQGETCAPQHQVEDQKTHA